MRQGKLFFYVQSTMMVFQEEKPMTKKKGKKKVSGI